MRDISAVDDPTDIYMWRRIDERLTTSGQPSEQQLRAIRELGVTHVVNLGPHAHEKALPDEPASVAAFGMDYIYIPVDFADPTEADFASFCSTMADLNGASIHVHCIANMRVSALLYRYHRDHRLMPEPAARALLEQFWRPGGVWATFIGDDAAQSPDHRYPGRDY